MSFASGASTTRLYLTALFAVVIGFSTAFVPSTRASSSGLATSSPLVSHGGPASDRPSDDDLERVDEAFTNLLERTGTLGSYRKHDGTIVVVIPASGSSSFAPSDAAALGLRVVTETRDIEPKDIEAIKALLMDSSRLPNRAFGRAVNFDPRLGKVRIHTDAPALDFAYVTDSYPGKVVVEPGAVGFLSRTYDVAPHYGGAQMNVSFKSKWCTSGFSVLKSGEPRMVTAGHCWELGDEVHPPVGDSYGTVKTRQFGAPSDNDFALVGAVGIGQAPYIYTGAVSGVKTSVANGKDAIVDVNYCFSGVTSYEQCQFYLVDDNDFLCDAQYGVCTFNLQYFETGNVGDGPCQGDSGSPFFRRYGNGTVGIRGIVVGGQLQTTIQACRTYNYKAWVERWTIIQNDGGVTIKTI